MENNSSRIYLYIVAVLLVAGLGWLMVKSKNAPAPASTDTSDEYVEPANSVSTPATGKAPATTVRKTAFTVLAPVSSDVWKRGVAYRIIWKGINRNITAIDLQLLTRPLTDAVAPVLVWRGQAGNVGNYTFVVPETLQNGTYRWKMTQGDAVAYSDYFDIR